MGRVYENIFGGAGMPSSFVSIEMSDGSRIRFWHDI
jgi:hypothetical protein